MALGDPSRGLEPGDVIVAFDGQTTAMTDVDVLAHCVQEHHADDEITATVLRAVNRVDVRLKTALIRVRCRW